MQFEAKLTNSFFVEAALYHLERSHFLCDEKNTPAQG
jgi:hypothetical protein